jgi:hypothetical protein
VIAAFLPLEQVAHARGQRRAHAGGALDRVDELGRVRGGQRHHRHVGRQVLRGARGVEADGGVRIEHFTGRFIGPAHGLGHLPGIATRAGEQPGDRLALGIGELQRLGGVELLHLRGKGSGIAPAGVEQQALEVRRDLDVHRRRRGGRHRAGGIIAGRQRAVENVVDVGGHDQPLDRQAHARSDIAGKDVTEIAGRHRERHLAVRRAKLERGGEVIDHLRHQPRPVDRVDRAMPNVPVIAASLNMRFTIACASSKLPSMAML